MSAHFYRSEIDGLRALAGRAGRTDLSPRTNRPGITLIRRRLFRGGCFFCYLGVFNYPNSVHRNRGWAIRFMDFYQRRARRILPMLFSGELMHSTVCVVVDVATRDGWLRGFRIHLNAVHIKLLVLVGRQLLGASVSIKTIAAYMEFIAWETILLYSPVIVLCAHSRRLLVTVRVDYFITSIAANSGNLESPSTRIRLLFVTSTSLGIVAGGIGGHSSAIPADCLPKADGRNCERVRFTVDHRLNAVIKFWRKTPIVMDHDAGFRVGDGHSVFAGHGCCPSIKLQKRLSA